MALEMRELAGLGGFGVVRVGAEQASEALDGGGARGHGAGLAAWSSRCSRRRRARGPQRPRTVVRMTPSHSSSESVEASPVVPQGYQQADATADLPVDVVRERSGSRPSRPLRKGVMRAVPQPARVMPKVSLARVAFCEYARGRQQPEDRHYAEDPNRNPWRQEGHVPMAAR